MESKQNMRLESSIIFFLRWSMVVVAVIMCSGARHLDFDFDLRVVGLINKPVGGSVDNFTIIVRMEIDENDQSEEIVRFQGKFGKKVDQIENINWGAFSETDLPVDPKFRVVVSSSGCDDHIIVINLSDLQHLDRQYEIKLGKVELACGK